MNDIEKNAGAAASYLKALASPHRLLILCQLVEGEKNVSELIALTGLAQTSMSQHLLKLKEEGIVDFRRDHRTLYYCITSDMALRIMQIMHDEFCQS